MFSKFLRHTLGAMLAVGLTTQVAQATTIRLEGYSYAGAYGFGQLFSLAKYYDIVLTAVGGSSMTDIFNRVSGVTAVTKATTLHYDQVTKKYTWGAMGDGTTAINDQLRDLYTVIWDGSPNGMGTPSAYVGVAESVVSLFRSGYLMIAPVALGTSTTGVATTWTKAVGEVYDLMAQAGMNVLNPSPILAALADGSTQDQLNVAAGYVPASLRAVETDIYHLNGKAHDAVAAAAYAQILATPAPVVGAGLLPVIGLLGFAVARRQARRPGTTSGGLLA